MKLHILTIGKPKLEYAVTGWHDYLGRLQRQHSVRTTHLADKFADDAAKIRETAGACYLVPLEVEGKQLSSPALAEFLQKRELEGREVCFVIGGPHGLPTAIIRQADYAWSLSQLTLPHDLAMVVTLEALYRATTINTAYPYHK